MRYYASEYDREECYGDGDGYADYEAELNAEAAGDVEAFEAYVAENYDGMTVEEMAVECGVDEVLGEAEFYEVSVETLCAAYPELANEVYRCLEDDAAARDADRRLMRAEAGHPDA